MIGLLMKRVRYAVYAGSLLLMAVVFTRIALTPHETEVVLGAGLPAGQEVRLDHEIVMVNDAPGDRELLEELADYLGERFAIPVRMVESSLDVTGAYAPDRDQYNVEVLVRLWTASVADDAGRLLVVTDKDTFVERLNWTTGCAMRGGPVAVMSIHRLRPEFWGRPADRDRLFQRAIRIATHELGHTWGKGPHCRNNCDLGSTNSIIDIDNLPTAYCGDCEALARDALRALRPGNEAP